MKRQQRSLLSGAACSLLGIGATSVSETFAAEQTTSRQMMVVEEVVVTAQKRAESLQQVPVAISAYTAETRDLRGVLSVPDLSDFTPGLNFSQGLGRMSVRGVGRLTNNYGSDPGLANYSDGFYTSSTAEAGKHPILVDRIEVLRGPQGTLYGRNSIGGAINIISKRPTDTFAGEVHATVGNYDTQLFGAALSGPVAEWLRFRVAGTSGGQGEGFYQDVDGGRGEGGVQDDRYVEGQLEFDIGESIEGWLKYSQAEWDRDGRSEVLITPYDIAPVYFSGLFPNATFNGTPTQPVTPAFGDTNPGVNNARLYDTDTPSVATLDGSHTYVLELVGHTGWADIKYTGGYQGYTYRLDDDFDGIDRGPYTTRPPTPPTTPGVTFTIFPQLESFYLEDKEYYSNEINLISTRTGPLQWILGLYQYHEQVNQFQGVRAPLQPELTNPRVAAPSAANRFNPEEGPTNPDRNLQVSGAFLDADARAVFGELGYSLSDAWKLTVGARYTEDRKDAEEYRSRILFGAPGVPYAFYASSVVDGTTVPEIDRRNHLTGKWHGTTGTAAIQWTPAADTLAFAKYTRGYKSGGFNAGQFAPGLTGYTEPEFIDAYEIGLKKTFANRLVANLSLFHYDYEDAQYPSTVRDPASNLNETRFFNLENAVSRGVELEALWAATDALQLQLSYSYLDTEIDDSRCFIDNADVRAAAADARPCSSEPAAQRGQSINGDSLPGSPENKIAFSADYTWRMPAGALTLSGSWIYRSETYYEVFSREHHLAPSYDETSLRALWSHPERNYTLIAFVRNVFDDESTERVSATESSWGVRSIEASLRPPRLYGLEVQFRFGH
ncbi:TonB-dependent receptor [Peristeroidobacter soli]|uniref:TonB-dependent receptor n=1 Tax=Peristeroidobacter soli TaxID=2497877 RepID=UPI00158CC997|nr:TonB-dependent receptor [Peristeroidobacter soli]